MEVLTNKLNASQIGLVIGKNFYLMVINYFSYIHLCHHHNHSYYHYQNHHKKSSHLIMCQAQSMTSLHHLHNHNLFIFILLHPHLLSRRENGNRKFLWKQKLKFGQKSGKNEKEGERKQEISLGCIARQFFTATDLYINFTIQFVRQSVNFQQRACRGGRFIYLFICLCH